LAEPHLTNSADLFTAVANLDRDSEPRVRFQCAVSLGATNCQRQIQALAAIAARDGADRWTRAAVLASAGTQVDDFFKAFLAATGEASPASSPMLSTLARLFGLSQPPEKCVAFLGEVMKLAAGTNNLGKADVITGLAEGLTSRGFGTPGHSPLMDLVRGDSPATQRLRAQLNQMFTEALTTACDNSQTLPTRLEALALLGQDDDRQVGPALLNLVTTEQPAEIQVAALRALGQWRGPATTDSLLSTERWRSYSPAVRDAALDLLMSHQRSISALLDALEKGNVQIWSLDPGRRNQLLKNKDETIRTRAAAVFKNQGGSDRQKVYEEYRSILSLSSSGRDGHEIFRRICVQCHTCRGEGAAVGPDLSGVHNQPAEALLLHILVPSYEIVPGYTSYIIETKDGSTLTGLIASETETSITLKRALGLTETILRTNIASISSSNLSLMPDELEKTMSRQELADLIRFLKASDAAEF
jgi:putative heme-binding domain-containing protein